WRPVLYQLSYGPTPAKWPGTESNRRHRDFQSRALPTELPGRPEPITALDVDEKPPGIEGAGGGAGVRRLSHRSYRLAPPARLAPYRHESASAPARERSRGAVRRACM